MVDNFQLSGWTKSSGVTASSLSRSICTTAADEMPAGTVHVRTGGSDCAGSTRGASAKLRRKRDNRTRHLNDFRGHFLRNLYLLDGETCIVDAFHNILGVEFALVRRTQIGLFKRGLRGHPGFACRVLCYLQRLIIRELPIRVGSRHGSWSLGFDGHSSSFLFAQCSAIGRTKEAAYLLSPRCFQISAGKPLRIVTAETAPRPSAPLRMAPHLARLPNSRKRAVFQFVDAYPQASPLPED